MKLYWRRIGSFVLILVIIVLSFILGRALKKAYRNEEEIKTALHRAHQWMSIIDSSSSAYVVVDEKGIIRLWSRGAQGLMGWNEEEAIGADMQLIIPPDRYEKHKRGFYDQDIRSRLIDHKEVIQVDGYVIIKSGKTVHVRIRISSIVNGERLFVTHLIPKDGILEYSGTLTPPKPQYLPPDLSIFRQGRVQEEN